MQATADAKAKQANPDDPTIATKETKLPELIICTGGSDALNVAALSHSVVWLNSETADVRPEDWKELSRLAEKVYNLPDIDQTGLKAAHKLAMQYLEIRTILLPTSLRERTDLRGNPCKDIRDYLRHHRKFESSIFERSRNWGDLNHQVLGDL